MMWGKHRENGVWLASKSRRRIILRLPRHGHDSLFIAAGRLRVRIMKP